MADASSTKPTSASSSTPSTTCCSKCGKDDAAAQVCGACRSVRYCSAACARADAPAHAQPCKDEALILLRALQKKADDEEDGEAAGQVGVRFLTGMGVPADVPNGVRYIKLAAKRGDTQGHFHLARLLERGGVGGKGTPPDTALALTHFRAAAEKGHLESEFMVAVYTATGKGGEAADLPQACERLRALIGKGHVGAAATLGSILVEGDEAGTVPKDLAEGVRLMRADAEAGYADAQLQMSLWLEKGLLGDGEGETPAALAAAAAILPKDPVAAEGYLRRSAAQGNTRALVAVGLAAMRQEPEPAYGAAFSSFLRAAELGDPEGATRAARFFIFPVPGGPAPNDAAAARLLTRAASVGEPEALRLLGTLHQEGKGVKQDLEEAARLFALAAELGVAVAHYDLAVLLLMGAGVRRDVKEAKRRLALAEAGGFVPSPEALLAFQAAVKDGGVWAPEAVEEEGEAAGAGAKVVKGEGKGKKGGKNKKGR
jgi:uncharacterized protein